jgi:hypothetical protein
MNEEEEKKTPLTAEEIETVRKADENLTSSFWKEILSRAQIPMKDHHVSREQVRQAYKKLGEVVEKWETH